MKLGYISAAGTWKLPHLSNLMALCPGFVFTAMCLYAGKIHLQTLTSSSCDPRNLPEKLSLFSPE